MGSKDASWSHQIVGDLMHYQSLIGLTAAALSLTFPSQAVAQSKPGQVRIAPQRATKWPSYRLEPVSFALQPKSVGYKLESASLASSSESTAKTLPDDSMRVVPEQRTKSAAYKWEAAFLALSAIDAAETISCLNRATCTEHNPIWGSHPRRARLLRRSSGWAWSTSGCSSLSPIVTPILPFEPPKLARSCRAEL